MLSAFRNAFKIPDLRNKILFTLFIIAIYRLGAHIPLPGVDIAQLHALERQASTTGGVYALINLFSGKALTQLNELEFVNGDVLANVYQTDWVLRIDPATGIVRQLLDFSDLYPKRPGSAEVMNGISVAPDTGALLLTGKLWPVMFEVRLKPAIAPGPT